MADSELGDLTADTAPASGDIVYVVVDPSGSKLARKMTVDNLLKAVSVLSEDTSPAATADYALTYDASASAAKKVLLQRVGTLDGWIPDAATWTYASASTFTVSGDVTAQFRKGTKLKLTQTTAKYFYVTTSSYGAPNTTVTVTGGTDYALANAAITSPYYSYAATPQGFPDWFAYTPAWTASGNAPSLENGTLSGVFRITGNALSCQILFAMGSSTTYGTGVYSVSIPVAAAAGVNWIGNTWVFDNNTGTNYTGVCNVNASASTLQARTHAATAQVGQLVPITFADGDQWNSYVVYRI